ncbi:MAG TPA: hypothetical protein VH208_08200, partial [Myxococcaceae bacterium]|nr:hypothetical protein [Myxococcaceae bacterium]
WSKTHASVEVDPIANEFRVEQRWRVTGTTRERLLAGVPHLTLTGKYGVYGDRTAVTTDVPVDRQNTGQGADGWAHPLFAPSALGARARTRPTAGGFRASMSEGKAGEGGSDVEIGHPSSDGSIEIIERGAYSLGSLRTGAWPLDFIYRLGSATVGRVPLAAAHKAMGELHNHMFNGAEPLVNWVNDPRGE